MEETKNYFNVLKNLSYIFLILVIINIIVAFNFDATDNKKNDSDKDKISIEETLENFVDKYPNLRNNISFSKNSIIKRLVIDKNIPLNSDSDFLTNLSSIIYEYDTETKKGNKTINENVIKTELENHIIKVYDYKSVADKNPYFVSFITSKKNNELIVSFNSFPSNSNYDLILLILNILFFILSIFFVINYFFTFKFYFLEAYNHVFTSYKLHISIYSIYFIITIIHYLLLFTIKNNIYTLFYNYCFEILHIYILIFAVCYLLILILKSLTGIPFSFKNENKSWRYKLNYPIKSIEKNWLTDFFVLSIKNETILKPNVHQYSCNTLFESKVYNSSVFYNIDNKNYLFTDLFNKDYFININDLIFFKKIRSNRQNFNSSVFLSIFISLGVSILFQYTYLDNFIYDFLGSMGFAFSLLSIILFFAFFIVFWLSSLAINLFSSKDSIIYDIILDELIANVPSVNTTLTFYNKVYLFEHFLKKIDKKISISHCTKKYIQNNENLFPAYFYKSISYLVHNNIDYRDILNNPNKFDAQFIKIDAQILNIELIISENLHYSIIRCSDYNNNLYDVCFIGELHDVSKADKLILVGMYLGISELMNEDNKIENVVLLAGSHIN